MPILIFSPVQIIMRHPILLYLLRNEVGQSLYNFNFFLFKISKEPNEINLLANKTFDYLNKSKMSIKNIKIVGYGASISCTTLIYHFKIQKFLNLIVDDNKAKFNTFLPGSNIKVYSSYSF